MKFVITMLMLTLLFSPIYAFPELPGKDKVMHFSGSAFITYWSYGLSRDYFNNSRDSSIMLSVSLTGTLGIMKESSNKYVKKTKWSWMDIAADFTGIACGLILINNLR